MKTLSSLMFPVVLATPSFSAEPAADDIHKQALGKWARDVEYHGDVYRMVKDVAKKKETVSVYNEDNELVRQWVVDIKIELVNGLSIFTFRNGKETAGPNKGEQWDDQSPKSYVFKIQNDKWYEVFNMFVGEGGEPSLNVYKRIE